MTGHNRIPTQSKWRMSDEVFESLVCGGWVGCFCAFALILMVIL